DRGARQAALMLPVLLAPLGIAVAIMLSLLVKGWAVSHSVIVQVEPAWIAGEPLGVRVHYVDGARAGIEGSEVSLRLLDAAGEGVAELGTLREGAEPGLIQGRFTAPAGSSGAGALELELRAPGRASVRERVDVTVDADRSARAGEHTISTSQLNWGDDTEPQPEAARLNVRPFGRLLAGFDNTLLVRALDADGRPHAGALEVALTDGEFMGQVGSSDEPPILFHGRADALGLVTLTGPFTSEILGLDLRLFPAEDSAKDDASEETAETEAEKKAEKKSEKKAEKIAEKAEKTEKAEKIEKAEKSDGANAETTPGAPSEPAEAGATTPKPLASRHVRMVSFSGAVRAYAEPLAVRAGETISLGARPLRARRPVFVDLHGADGVWLDTLDPPLVGREPPRDWSTAGVAPGLLQLEAYHYFNKPGESAAVALFQVTEGDPAEPSSLAPLLERQRARLDVARVEKDFDKELEQRYLKHLEGAAKSPEEVATARRWLTGTLPVHVFNPPAAMSTRTREEEALRITKRRWNLGLYWFLVLGGGGFLVLTTLLIMRSHGRMARATARALLGDSITDAEELAAIRQAQRAVLVRGGALIASMALGLVLAIVVLNKLVWEF
ncbi:MAG: hypothetical protein KC468_05920, partial [Myxococcales bacterium]|nr:hypothetical protein [Myxococcales bacterium]